MKKDEKNDTANNISGLTQVTIPTLTIKRNAMKVINVESKLTIYLSSQKCLLFIQTMKNVLNCFKSKII